MENPHLVWPSPAKLNLFLHINGRREDGYHELQSLFQMLDYGDELRFTPSEDGKIAMTTPLPGVSDTDNLIIRAARLLQQHCGSPKGVRITLNKHLPMGGGVGGGSSNAATTLVALNQLWGTGLDEDELAELGLSLGADVPIFVRGHTAFAEGVGEKITPTALAQKYYLVVNPNVHVATAEIFQHPDLPRDTAKIDLADYEFEKTTNNCQKIAALAYPEIEKCLHWLLEYAPSRMTGTGACLFAVFDDLQSANKVLKLLPDAWTGFVAKGVNQSPLKTTLAGATKAQLNAHQ